jgi:hypothetical protein
MCNSGSEFITTNNTCTQNKLSSLSPPSISTYPFTNPRISSVAVGGFTEKYSTSVWCSSLFVLFEGNSFEHMVYDALP